MFAVFRPDFEGCGVRALFGEAGDAALVSTDPNYACNAELVADHAARVRRLAYFWSVPYVQPRGQRHEKLRSAAALLVEKSNDWQLLQIIKKHSTSALLTRRGLDALAKRADLDVALAANAPLPPVREFDAFLYMLAQIIGTTFATAVVNIELAELHVLRRRVQDAEEYVHRLSMAARKLSSANLAKIGRYTGVDGFAALCLLPPFDVALCLPSCTSSNAMERAEPTACQPVYAAYLNLGAPLETADCACLWRYWSEMHHICSAEEYALYAGEFPKVFEPDVCLVTYGAAVGMLLDLVKAHGLRVRMGVASCNYPLVPHGPALDEAMRQLYIKSPVLAWAYKRQIFTLGDDHVDSATSQQQRAMFADPRSAYF